MRPFRKSPIMQRLYPLQNPHFGSKIKIPKNMSKSILQIISSCSLQKLLQKTVNIQEMRPFWKSPIMQRLYPLQNPHFGSKIKMPKNISKSISQIIASCSRQKTTSKNTKYSRNETILKMAHHGKTIAFPKSSLWVKN